MGHPPFYRRFLRWLWGLTDGWRSMVTVGFELDAPERMKSRTNEALGSPDGAWRRRCEALGGATALPPASRTLAAPSRRTCRQSPERRLTFVLQSAIFSSQLTSPLFAFCVLRSSFPSNPSGSCQEGRSHQEEESYFRIHEVQPGTSGHCQGRESRTYVRRDRKEAGRNVACSFREGKRGLQGCPCQGVSCTACWLQRRGRASSSFAW